MEFEEFDWEEGGGEDSATPVIAAIPFSQISFDPRSNGFQNADVLLRIHSHRKLSSKNGGGISIDVTDGSDANGVKFVMKSTLTAWAGFHQFEELCSICANGGGIIYVRMAVLKNPFRPRPGFCPFEFSCCKKTNISVHSVGSGLIKFSQKFLFSAQKYLTIGQLVNICSTQAGTGKDFMSVEGCIAGVVYYIGEIVPTSDTSKYSYYLPVAILDASLKMINVYMYFCRKEDYAGRCPQKPSIFFVEGDGLIFNDVMINSKTLIIQCFCPTLVPECLVTYNTKISQAVSSVMSKQLQDIRKERTLEGSSPKDPYYQGINAFLQWLIKVYKPSSTNYEYVSSFNIIMTRIGNPISVTELKYVNVSGDYGSNDKIVTSIVKGRVYSMEPYYRFLCPVIGCNQPLKNYYDPDNSIFAQCSKEHRLPDDTHPKMVFALRLCLTDENFDYYSHKGFEDKNTLYEKTVSVVAGFDVLGPMFDDNAAKEHILYLPDGCDKPLLYLSDQDKLLLFKERFKKKGGSITLKVRTSVVKIENSEKRYHNVTEILDSP